MKQNTTKIRLWANLLSIAVLSYAAAGCRHYKDLDDILGFPKNEMTYYGPTTAVGNGTARTWVSVDKKGNPTGIGVNVSETATASMGNEHQFFLLPLPKEASRTPVDHLTLEWNPQGHEPEHIYDKPHFDLHFYLITQQERQSISPMSPPYMDPAPAAKYMPANYLQTPGVVPAMGVHWVDLLSNEFKPGGEFSKTLILGTYGGKLIFFEPMFTRDYLNTKPTDIVPIRQPQAFEESGYYPTKYSVIYRNDTKEFTFSLNDLTYRQGE